MKQFFSQLWKRIYKNPRNRFKEERLLKRRLAFVDSIKQSTNNFDKEILVLRTDDIGDYILFRNSLEIIRKNYPDYKITLLGHQLWQPIAENWDSKFVDDFIWLDKGAFQKKENYTQTFLKSIATKKPEILLAPSYSRNTFIDGVIAHLIPAKQKWAWQRNDKETKLWLRNYCDAPFTDTIPIPEGLHEFDLNIAFIEKITQQKTDLKQPFIPKDKLPKVEGLPKNYVVLFPGAAAKRKRWNTNNFAKIADYIIENYQLTCVICGSKGDAQFANSILSNSRNKNSIVDFSGKTDLLQLATVISNCSLIITNDTSAAHYAAALGQQIIALLNGNSYGRFFPYPKEYHPHIISIYPSSLTNPPHDWVGSVDINKITVEQVLQEVGKQLKV